MRPERFTIVFLLLLATLWQAVAPCSCLFCRPTHCSTPAGQAAACESPSVCCHQQIQHQSGSCNGHADNRSQSVESSPERAPAAPCEHRQCRRSLIITGTEAGQQRREVDHLLSTFDPAPGLFLLFDQPENWRLSRIGSHGRWNTCELRGTVRLQV